MSTKDTDTNSTVGCPSCEREFASERGVKIHHSSVHDESIAGIAHNCVICGEKFTTPPNREDAKCCSVGCKSVYQSRNITGSDNPNWNGGEAEIECVVCGDIFTDRSAHASWRKCCSKSCQQELQSGQITGENNPQWSGGDVKLECTVCGSEYTARQSNSDTSKYCSVDCKSEWESEHHSGSDSPRWKGGAHDYGPNWFEQRDRALKRDNHQCQACSVTEKEHLDEHGEELHVHHIIPARNFGDDFERMNALENLVTLCRNCHSKWEGIPLRPQ